MTEGAVQECSRDLILRTMQQSGLLRRIVEKTNTLLAEQLPKLEAQQRKVQTKLASINAQAQRLLEQSAMLGEGEVFAKEELERLARQRRQLEEELRVLGTMVEETEARAFDREGIIGLLSSFEEVFQADMKPYQRKQLLRWALERIELSTEGLRVGLKVRPAVVAASPPVGENQPDVKPALGSGSQLFGGGADEPADVCSDRGRRVRPGRGAPCRALAVAVGGGDRRLGRPFMGELGGALCCRRAGLHRPEVEPAALTPPAGVPILKRHCLASCGGGECR